MARSSPRSAEQISAAVPPAASLPEKADSSATETKPWLRTPFIWRLVFIVWGIAFALLVLYEVIVLLNRLTL